MNNSVPDFNIINDVGIDIVKKNDEKPIIDIDNIVNQTNDIDIVVDKKEEKMSQSVGGAQSDISSVLSDFGSASNTNFKIDGLDDIVNPVKKKRSSCFFCSKYGQ